MKIFFTTAENKDNVQKHVLLYTILLRMKQAFVYQHPDSIIIKVIILIN
jgi:hypothetical protein